MYYISFYLAHSFKFLNAENQIFLISILFEALGLSRPWRSHDLPDS
jgi:hypothetical protein